VTPTISVALCTFNGERFIAEQVGSILSQTHLPQEIVVSDDGSTDGTVLLVEAALGAFNASHPRTPVQLTVLRNANALGVVRNFEQAISATKSELVVLCDQDDRWGPERIEVALAEFETRPNLLLLFGDARLIDDRGDPLRYSLFDALAITPRERTDIRAGNGLAALLARNIATGATTMFRRKLLRAALPFPREWIHDEWLAAIGASTGQIDFVDAALIDYRQHGANVIGAQKLSFAAKVGKLREPRESRNQLLVDRASVLVDRLSSLAPAVRSSDLVIATAKLSHERSRQALPRGRLARVRPVLRELRSGGYRRYGRGLQDVFRDLVQPAGYGRGGLAGSQSSDDIVAR
jgi:glycosyltransferase involved in cell wall biosynthesis